MKAIILAAGYATRLYPLTKNCPKPLLKIGERAILDFILEKIEVIPEIDGIYIVTNEKFASDFEKYIGQAVYSKPIKVMNDGTLSNEDRLGAIGDIEFAIQEEQIADDLLIVAGDNLFGFDLNDMVSTFHQRKANVIALYRESDPEQLIRGGTALMDDGAQVIAFEEKPQKPNYPYSVPTFYIIQQKDVHLFGEYLSAGNNPDANGNFIPYLINKSTVYGFEFHEYRYDIGTIESYERAKKLFE